MTKVMIAVAGMMVAFGTTSVFAGAGCCPASKEAKAAKSVETAKAGSCGMECFDGVDLSDAQMEQIKALKAECSTANECSIEAAKQMEGKLATILSAEQMAKMKATCAAKGCAATADTKKESTEEATETAG